MTREQIINFPVTKEMRIDMINWAKDCIWEDYNDTEFDDFTNAALVRGIESNYYGGMAGFLADSSVSCLDELGSPRTRSFSF